MYCLFQFEYAVYITSEDILEMVEKACTSTDALSDYDSSAGSTISSVWESSEPDNRKLFTH